MSSWYYDYDASEQKESLQRELQKRRQRGETYDAFVAPEGTKLTRNFWGKAWCSHLEKYGGYDARLSRGRSYLRQGKVYNLTIDEGLIAAEVAGSSLYEVEININPLAAARWKEMKKQCTGQVASLLDLLSGKLGPGLMEIITHPDKGLFPRRREFTHHCSCPDYADLCKHQSAVLYAVGVLFDRDPNFFFQLRGVDPSELIATSASALTGALENPGGDLAGEDLGALFGIDLDPVDAPPPAAQPAAAAKAAAAKAATAKKSPAKKSPPKKSPAKKSAGRKPTAPTPAAKAAPARKAKAPMLGKSPP